jgi:hypothetical protein
MGGMDSQSCFPESKTCRDVLHCHSADAASWELGAVEESLQLMCGPSWRGSRSDTSCFSYYLSRRRGDVKLVQPFLTGATMSSVWANDSNHILVPMITMGGPRFFLPKSTQHMGVPFSACVGLQEGEVSFKES